MTMEMDLKRVAHLGIALAAALAMGSVNGAGQAPVVDRGQAAAAADNQSEMAFALEQQGNNAEAETAWRAILQGHPANSEAYAHLGFLEARQEHYTEAVPLYRKALQLNPAMPGVRLNLGLSLFKSGALKEAIQTFHSASKECASILARGAAPDYPYRAGALWAGRIRDRDSLSEAGHGRRPTESSLPPGPGAQLPLVQAVSMRSRCLPRDPYIECGIC